MKPAHHATRATPAAIAAALLLAIGFTTASATPLDTRGIPAGAGGIIHLDYDLFAKSALNASAKKFSEKAFASQGVGDIGDFQKQTGVNPDADIRAVTIGLFKPSADKPGEPQTIVVIRGNFTPAKLVDYAKQLHCPVTTRGGMTVISSPEKKAADDSAADDNGDDDDNARGMAGMIRMGRPGQTFFAGIVDNSTILVAGSLDILDKSAASLSGGGYSPPASFSSFCRREGTPWLSGCIDKELTGGAAAGMMPAGDVKNIQFSIAETGSRLRARALSEYGSAGGATQAKNMFQGLLGFLQMGASQAKTPEAAAQAKKMKLLVDSLKMTQDGASLDLTLDLSAADAAELMNQ